MAKQSRFRQLTTSRTRSVLSRLIIEIANNATLGEELVFRGGTCLHKLYLSKPLRYSEDLDYV
jgi:predicted nucleotidyltransferase component of viral defense system